jgi:tetratricopeptide (TPR) repeat protein
MKYYFLRIIRISTVILISIVCPSISRNALSHPDVSKLNPRSNSYFPISRQLLAASKRENSEDHNKEKGHLSLPVGTQSDLEDILKIADILGKNGDLHGSIIEYKRYLFFAGNSKNNKDIYGKIGLLYQSLKEYQFSIDYLQLAYNASSDENEKALWAIRLITTYILSQDYENAELVILKVLQGNHTNETQYHLLKTRLILEIYRKKWALLGTVLQELEQISIDPKEDEKLHLIQSLLDQEGSFHEKSEKIAVFLSVFIPGLGQCYAGNWKNGLNALIINVGSGAILYNQFEKQLFTDAILFTISTAQKYYRGNLYKAKMSVRTFNDKSHQSFAMKLLSVLMQD